ncbi:hypothetical protein XF36_21430 [Pseudonocardia sp. HH130629-09]|nr:hypothetical protein XF36_21430 [Pseudonocardia sp. HH130629-09]
MPRVGHHRFRVDHYKEVADDHPRDPLPSWSETLRGAAQRTGAILRAIWAGVDTWNAVTHGRAPSAARR